jgi:putative RNA 2'-phosphotransferase
MELTIKQISRRMSALLRHRALEAGLVMDHAGWVDMEELIAHLGVPRSLVEEVVQQNNKMRFEVAGPRIRASQGHSLEGMPVTREALEASWTIFSGDGSLWHGTGMDAARSIAQQGILSSGRTHVHLAETKDSHVGKRGNVDVLLEVSPIKLRAAEQLIFKSANGVILCRHVPRECIIGAHPVTRKSRSGVPVLRALFGMSE